ncbi:MAG: B12-binding domain-containing radical SAM protein [Lachnospiraceae bacterium]|nr:B12-binding domain-containing radical SAM protein [Lachnospiraceae bacterium]
MYIKLIQPKMIKRPMDTDLKLHMAPPLGLLTIVNLLRKEHTVSLENENIQSIDYNDNPDMVGISVTVDTLPGAIRIARKFRDKGSIVVAGGIHITTAHDTIPQDAFDVLCIGAAEGTWPDIIKDYENGTLKPIYKCNKDFDGKDIVPPAYDFITKDKYLYCNIIHTSRGCPFRCDFCYNSATQRSYVNRDIEDVLQDIKAVKSKHIMFIDDNFAGNPVWLKDFLNRLIPLNIKWNAAVSLNALLDEALLDLMKSSGCQGLFVGFESIQADSINDVHKIQNNINTYEKAIKMAHDRGIMINASFVFGLDGDTSGTFKSTLDWIVKNKIETVTSHILTPYPGTALYDRLKKEGRIISDDLSEYNTAHVVFRPAKMTEQELYDGYIWIYKQIYSFKNIMKRMPEDKSQRAAYFLFNFLYRKYGKFTDFVCKIITYKNVGIIAEKLSRYL